MSYLLILYFAIFLIISLKNLKWGIFWTIFSLPIYLIRFKVFSLPTTVLEIQILLLFIVWLIKTLKYKKIKTLKQIFIQNKLLSASCLLFIVAATISIFISPDLRAAAGIWKVYFIEPILFLIIFVSVIKKSDFKTIFRVLSLQILILSLFAIVQKFTGIFISNPFWQAEATRRVTSVFPYPNALALYLAPIIIMLFGFVIYNLKKIADRHSFITYYLLLIISILGIVAIYFTKSKGALLAILMGIIFYAIFYKGHRKVFLSILIILLFSFLLINFLTDFDLSKTLKGNSTVTGGDSISTRLEMWSETWQMLKTQPILGAGLAGYQSAVASFHQKEYIEIYLYPHNIILNFWTEIGLIGLLAFLGIIIWFYKTGTGNKNYGISIILMASMIVLLIHGLVDVPYFKNDLAILFWLIMGMMIINNNKKYDKKNLQQINS